MKYELYFDGSDVSFAAILLKNGKTDRLIAGHTEKLDNNIQEFNALIFGMQLVQDLKNVHFYGDSKTVIDAMNGYGVNDKFANHYKNAKNLHKKGYKYSHVNRKDNENADKLARCAKTDNLAKCVKEKLEINTLYTML